MFEFIRAIFQNMDFIIWFSIASIIIIAVIRLTKTKTDDKCLEFVAKGLSYAISLVPNNSRLNWIKLSKNAINKFADLYLSEKGRLPDESVVNWAWKNIIKEAKEINGLTTLKKK